MKDAFEPIAAFDDWGSSRREGDIREFGKGEDGLAAACNLPLRGADIEEAALCRGGKLVALDGVTFQQICQ